MATSIAKYFFRSNPPLGRKENLLSCKFLFIAQVSVYNCFHVFDTI